MNIELNPGTMEADVFLMSDTKAEVTSAATIVGMPKGYTIAPFSKLMTASKELAIMQSDGTWKW